MRRKSNTFSKSTGKLMRYLIAILTFACFNLYANKLDSLKKALTNTTSDTSYTSTLLLIAEETVNFAPDTAIIICDNIRQRISLLRNADVSWKETAVGKSYYTSGLAFALLGKKSECFSEYDKAISIWNRLIKTLNNNKKYLLLKAATLNRIGNAHKDFGEYQQAIEKYMIALDLDERCDNQRGVARELGNIGTAHNRLSNFHEASQFILRAIKIDSMLKNMNGVARHYGNLGNVLVNVGKIAEGMQAYYRSLALYESLNNNKGILLQLGGLAGVYGKQGNTAKAIEMYEQAISIAEANGTIGEFAFLYGNIAIVYHETKQNRKAEQAYFKAIELYRRTEDRYGLANTYANLGIFYQLAGNKAKALEHYQKALTLQEKSQSNLSAVTTLENIGNFYLDNGQYELARKYLSRSLKLSREHNFLEGIMNAEKSLCMLDSSSGNYKGAYTHFKIYCTIKDSLTNEENTRKQTQVEMQYAFDKKEEEAKAEQLKKDAVAKSEKRKQRIWLYAVAGGFHIVLCISFFMLRAYRQKRKANNEITIQKNIIEEKQKEILDSINYAKRIQESLMPSEQYIEKALFRLGRKSRNS